jgi:acetyl-CoA carboxylase carboxyltransferase component
MSFAWKKISLEDHRFLAALRPLFSSPSVEAWGREDLTELERTDCDGLLCLRGWLNGSRVGVVQCDFRVNGGSFGHDNSKRLTSFLEQMSACGAPVFMAVNSIGVRIMEGRTVFGDAFSIWPALTRFRKTGLLITLAMGKCLGLGALLYGLGHYRMAVGEETHINLTGPEVMKLFFGEKFSFEDFASAERQSRSTDLVHELVADRAAGFERAKALLGLANPSLPLPSGISMLSEIPGLPQQRDLIREKLNSILDEVSPHRFELFPELSPIVKIFITERDGQKIGVFVNPPGNANNMITIEALQKYAAGLDFFRSIGVPVVSLLDSPGADPRLEQSDRNNIRSMIWVGDKIIFYPHGTMGIVIGRCFGGATTLGFPKVFGGLKTLVLKGAKLGVIHESIIRTLLSGSPRLLSTWETVHAKETSDAADLIASGIVDQQIEQAEIGGQISLFIEELRSRSLLKNLLKLSDRRMAQAPYHADERRRAERRLHQRVAS